MLPDTVHYVLRHDLTPYTPMCGLAALAMLLSWCRAVTVCVDLHDPETLEYLGRCDCGTLTETGP